MSFDKPIRRIASRPRVVVVGGRFGGVAALRALKHWFVRAAIPCLVILAGAIPMSIAIACH